MVTGVYAAHNIMGGHHDVWSVNTEKEYHEEGREGILSNAGDRMAPRRIHVSTESPLNEVEAEFIGFVFAKLDPVALGVAVGTVSGIIIFLATAILVIKGGPVVGPTLSLLGNFLYGFEVTWGGALVGLVEGGLVGFGIGYIVATLRNWTIKAYARLIRSREEAARRRNLLDKV